MKKLYKERISKLSFIKSKYPCRPMVFFFRYPQNVIDLYAEIGKEVVKDHPKRSPAQKLGPEKLGVLLSVPDKSDILKFSAATYLAYFSAPMAKIARVYSTMKDIMKNNGFVLSKSQKYNFCWGFSKHRAQIKYLTHLQKFSHFQGCWQLGRKDFLWQNVQRKRQKFPHLLDFMPLTYCLKSEYEAFLANRHTSQYWIIKPVDAARGEGIFVVGSTEEVKMQKGSRL